MRWYEKCGKDAALQPDILLDTDVIIWYLRGNPKAYELIHALPSFAVSAVTYMELVQGMRNKEEVRRFK